MTGKEADIMTIEKILEIISDREKPVHHIRDKKYKEAAYTIAIFIQIMGIILIIIRLKKRFE